MRLGLAPKDNKFNAKDSDKKFVPEASLESRVKDFRDDRVGGYVAHFEKELSESSQLKGNFISSTGQLNSPSKGGRRLDPYK